jgi:glycosyltransferase involved in cell wall biosynthesis
MPLKVLMVCPEFYPNLGGTEIQALNLSKALQCKGVHVRVLTRMRIKTWKAQESIEGISVSRIDYPRIRLLGGGVLNIRLAWDIIRNYRDFDIFHFHIGGSHMILPLLLVKFLKKPSLLKISGWWEMERGFLNTHGVIPRLMRKLLFNIDTIIAVSDEIKKLLIAHGYPAHRILCLANGVDTLRFHPVVRESATPRIIFVGRLVAEKGVQIFLQAAEKLKAVFPDVQIDLAGEGDSEENLRQMTIELGLANNVNFLGRLDNVAEALRNADIYIQPSLNEGLPNSLLEAMACGLPVVVTKVGGMPDVVTDGVHGFVVEPDNVTELAEALGNLLRDEPLRREMGKEGCARIQREFSLDSIAEKYITNYRKMINGNT